VIAVLDMGQSMARGQAVLLFLVPWMAVAASAAPAPAPPPAPAAAPQSDWPPGAPVAAAVLVYRGERCRLAITDLVHGTYEDLGPADDVEPVWSPDGTQLAYISGSTLTILRPGKGPAIRVRGGMPQQSWGQYAFSPDGQRLAVATPKSLEIYSLGETAKRIVAAPSKLILSRLTWSQDGQQLAVCRWDGDDGPGSHESLALYSLEGTTLRTRVLRASFPSCQILGVRNGLWLATRGDDAAEVVAISTEGKLSRLRTVDSEYEALAYLAARDAIAAAGETEASAPSRWALFSLSGKRQRPFLRQFQYIYEVKANEDGSYVLVNVPFPSRWDDPLGRVFISATDGTFSRQVLPAPGSKSKNRAFSHPVPRPLLRTSP
jgi:dipeptidyl aminopeptidase/acylaminoacyl peptidase